MHQIRNLGQLGRHRRENRLTIEHLSKRRPQSLDPGVIGDVSHGLNQSKEFVDRFGERVTRHRLSARVKPA
jgi:hypothetical protein